MTRVSILFIVIGVLLGALFYWNVDMERERDAQVLTKTIDAKVSAKGTVVYAIRDIREGSIITADAINQHTIELNKVPDSAITMSSIAVGKTAKYGISSGQIVSVYNLEPRPLPSQTP